MFNKILLISLLFTLVQADTIYFSNGAVLNGKITNQTQNIVTISVNEKLTTYSKNDIKNIEVESKISAPPPPPSISTSPMPSVKKTIKAGTVIHTITTQAINSSTHKTGHKFQMKLESNIIDANGNVLMTKGSNIYAVVVSSEQAGRLVGNSKMIISLTALSLGSTRVAIKTDAINILAPKKQGRDTASKVFRGAAIGALVNGNDGARDGAKVGAGLAILTRGKSTGIPAGTLLDFTLISQVNIK